MGAFHGEADFIDAQADEAEDGRGVFLGLEAELARNWSAASHRRFSSAALSVSFSDGAIQIMLLR